MNSRIIGGIAAFVLAVVGAVLLFAYVGAADRRAQDGLDPQEVLVAVVDAPEGTAVEDLGEYLEASTLPATAVAEGALSSLDGQQGLVLAHPLLAGEQLLETKLVDPEEQLEPGTVSVPAGLQEVTVVLDPARVVGGKIRAGDRVAIYGNYELRITDAEGSDTQADGTTTVDRTSLLMEQVLVTGVQIATPQQTDAVAQDGVSALPSGSAFVTFAVDADQAGRIIFTQDFGLTWLTKQSESTSEAEVQDWDVQEVLR